MQDDQDTVPVPYEPTGSTGSDRQVSWSFPGNLVGVMVETAARMANMGKRHRALPGGKERSGEAETMPELNLGECMAKSEKGCPRTRE